MPLCQFKQMFFMEHFKPYSVVKVSLKSSATASVEGLEIRRQHDKSYMHLAFSPYYDELL